MNKRKLLLLVIALMLLTGWYCLFYKSYSNTNVPHNADVVISVDVKRNTNTILAYLLTTPAEWNLHSLFSSNKDTSFDWRDAIQIPDYIFIFHCKDQPTGIYYCVLNIKDDAAFQKGINSYGFSILSKEKDETSYFSAIAGMELIKKDNRIIIGTSGIQDHTFIESVADKIFNKKEFLDMATLKKIVAPPNHFSIYIQQNNFLQEATILNGNFNKEQLTIDGFFKPYNEFSFTQDSFEFPPQSLLNLAFTHPSTPAYALVPDSFKNLLSRALNFNIDSLLIPTYKKYSLNISGINWKFHINSPHSTS